MMEDLTERWELLDEVRILRARVAELETANALLRHDCAKAGVDIAERDLVIDTLEAQLAEYRAGSLATMQAIQKAIEDAVTTGTGTFVLPTSSGEG